MKISLNKKEIHGLDTIYCELGVRYWEDAEVNGIEDNADNPTIPCCHTLKDGKKYWLITIDANNGKIIDWPTGVTANVHYKVCDDGLYSFIDADHDVIKEVRNYVPKFLCPKEDGYGDYVIMGIDENGYIQDWHITETMVQESIDTAF